MKAIKLISVLILIFISLCLSLAQFDVGLQLTNSTCYNSVKDASEEGIDCGGMCAPCPSQEPNPPRGSKGSSGGSSSIISEKNYSIKVEIPKKEDYNYTEEIIEFNLFQNTTFDFFIDLSNLGNVSREVNISLLNVPDFLEISYEKIIVPADSTIRIAAKTNPEYYKSGFYDAVILLSSGNFVKKINLKFEIKEETQPSIDSPIKTILAEPKTPYIIGLFLVFCIIVFVQIKQRISKK
jgi:hypothetical protein